ncbi:ketopantoate reductase C-terminal domain-containing protein [Aquimarina gracilis]|uniref:2-dehydropantoate 2-reductase n=1 Tax=Aquimarina gracilis TaxID=874422 RepID=A0ABU5ZRQ6_9FLAO|nr:ketopantoate reductase C-terminal domain-containing protein [Aquimarina gracilis]MEB3344750.1 ketopantoate reductase C-terminal domain-containing protein [Aquimarina gracilis]
MSNEKIKIGILGIGSIGSVISYLLKENKFLDLFYYNRTPKSHIKILFEGSEHNVSIDKLNNFNKKLDWLLICLKEHQYKSAENLLIKLINPDTKVVSVRNGLNHKAHLLKYTRQENILECIIDCPTQLKQNGIYEQLREPIITLPKSRLATGFENLFVRRSIDINQVEDFKTESWKKVCESSALGAILCLSGETCWIFQDREMLDLYKSTLKETVQVAKADGASIEDDFVDEMVVKLLSYPKEKSSSMLLDRLKGNPIELGAKNGVITEIGKQRGVPTPINDLFVTLLKKTNAKNETKNN